MYEDRTRRGSDVWYQGDIITNFPTFIFPNGQKFFRQREGSEDFQSINSTTEVPTLDGAWIGAPMKNGSIMILSQTCDIQDSTHLIIAPIYTLEFMENAGVLSKSNVGHLQCLLEVLCDTDIVHN